jgi:hypothetical protein
MENTKHSFTQPITLMLNLFNTISQPTIFEIPIILSLFKFTVHRLKIITNKTKSLQNTGLLNVRK